MVHLKEEAVVLPLTYAPLRRAAFDLLRADSACVFLDLSAENLLYTPVPFFYLVFCPFQPVYSVPHSCWEIMHSPETYIRLFFFAAANLSFFSNQTALCHLKQFALRQDAQYLQCILMSYFFRIQMHPELQILRHPCKNPHPAKNFPVSFLSLPATYLSFAPIITIVFSVCFFLIPKDSLAAQ